MSQDQILLNVPEKNPGLGGANTGMSGASYFSLGNEKSVVEMPALPAWMINTPMHSKLPIIDAPKGKYILFTTGLCEKLNCTPSDLDFDSSPQTISVQYKSLHDSHLKWHYNRTAVYKRLIKNGSITSDGKVICTLKEFNDYHQYLKQIRLSKIKHDRKRMMEEKQKQKMKSGIKNGENESIRDNRAREAKERKKKQQEEKEARLNEMLSIEKLRYIRLEEKMRLKQKHKTCMKMAQDKRNDLKAQQAIEERKHKAKLIRMRSLEDKKRAEKLDRSRCAQREEREEKLEQKWNLRERLREMRLLGEIAERERRQLNMANNIAEREASVEQTRTRQRAVFQNIQEERSKQIEEREQLLSRRLDVKLKKVQERFQKRIQPKKVPRPKAANSSRRSRFSSTWSLERTLRSPDFKPCDDSWIQKLKAVKCDEAAQATETEDFESMESHETQEIHSRKTSTHSSLSRISAENSETGVGFRNPSVATSHEATTDNEEGYTHVTEECSKPLPKSVNSVARGLVCNILQSVAEEQGYDGYYLSPQISPAGSDKDVVNRCFVAGKTTDGGSDGEDDWYAAANNIVGQAIDGAIEFLENNPELVEPEQSGRVSSADVARDNIRRQSIILSSVLNMMDDTGLDLHYVSSSEGNVTDGEDDDDENIIGIIDNTASSTNGDGDWQVQGMPEQSPVSSTNNFSGSRRRSVNEAILAPETLCGFHELEGERVASSVILLDGSTRRLVLEERHIQRRHTVPDIVPVFNNVQLNIDQNTVDSNLCAISIKPNTANQMAHTPIERNSFRDIFKPDMTNCKGTADCLREVLTQQLSQRRASLRYGDIQHTCDILVENPDEESYHQEDVVSVEDIGGFCYLPKRTPYRHSKLDEVSEKVTEEAIEEQDGTQGIDDEELETFAQQMVTDVLKRVKDEVPVQGIDDEELETFAQQMVTDALKRVKDEVPVANQTEGKRGTDTSHISLSEDGVLHTTHHVHKNVIYESDDAPGVDISTVSTRTKDVDDVEWYDEWLAGTEDSQSGKSAFSRTSKRTKSKESTKVSSQSSIKRRKTSNPTHLSKRSNSVQSFKEAMRSNSAKTRVVSSEPIKATALTSDESGSSANSRIRRRSESFISRVMTSVRDFFTSSKHKTEEDDETVITEAEVPVSLEKDRRIKSEEIIEKIIRDSLDNKGTRSMHNDFGSNQQHRDKDAKESAAVEPETASNEQSSKREGDSISKQSVTEIDVNKLPSGSLKIRHEEICESVLSESVGVTNGTMPPGKDDQEKKETVESKPNLNDDSRVSVSSKTSCISAVGTKNEITTEEIDAIRSALQPCQTGINDLDIKNNKPSKTPPASRRLQEEDCSQKEDSLSRNISVEQETNRPRPPSKKRENSSSSSLRRNAVVHGPSHKKVKSEVNTTTEQAMSSRTSKTCQHSVTSIKIRGRKDSDYQRSSTVSMEAVYSEKLKSRSSKNSTSTLKNSSGSDAASRKVSGKASKEIGANVNPELSKASPSDKDVDTLSSADLAATECNAFNEKPEAIQHSLPANSSATLSHTSSKGSGSIASRNQSHHSSRKTKMKSSTVSSESKIGKNSSLHSGSHSHQSFSSDVPNTVNKVASANIPPSSRKSSSRRSSSTKPNGVSSDDGIRKRSSDISGRCSTSNTRKSSNHRGSTLTSTIQSRTSSQRTHIEGTDLDVKSSYKDEVKTINDNHDSSTSYQSVKSHRGSALTSTVQSRTSSQRTDIERPDLDDKTSSKDDVNAINDKENSSTNCQYTESQNITIETDTVTNSTEDVRKHLGNEPMPSLSSTSLKENHDRTVEGTEANNIEKTSPEDLNTSTIDELSAGKVENFESTSKSSSGRLLSRPQSNENRLRLVNEADIASSEITSSVLCTVSNLPEISRPSSTEIVLNPLTADSKSPIALELDCPKAPEPPIANQESSATLSPKQFTP